jgi:ribonucleoside-diphosphate reductase alpha chain
MDISSKILSDITVFTKYAKYLAPLKRRETWEELVYRNMSMHIDKYPHMEEEIIHMYQRVLEKDALPSMRSLQFGGRPIEINNARMFNCAFMHVNDFRVFGEAMFLLLSGSGVGFSCQKHHVEKLPQVHAPTRNRKYLINDSIIGWADSINVLIKAYMKGKPLPIFDYREIRPKGAKLITAGGKAPGPEPLKTCHHNITKILDRAIAARGNGTKLNTLDVYDMMCFVADAVLSGGIRRSATIAIFSYDDDDMLTSKYGNWYESDPQRARANNSVMLVKHKLTMKDFFGLWEKIQASGSGDPGFIMSNNSEWGFNPCVEASLEDCGFCNLTTIPVHTVTSQADFEHRCRVATFIGTLQAGYTDFHFLRDKWRHNAEKKPLLGVSMTGIASAEFLKYDLKAGALVCVAENIRVSKLIGINSALRICNVKPEGTVSCVVGSSSGIHAWHNDYYIRRVRVGKNEALYTYLVNNHPELVEDEFFKPKEMAVISIPMKAPEGAILRSESPIDLLERVKRVNEEWIVPSHIKGDNTHNVSCTVNLRDEDWESVGKWMWENRNSYAGLSILPAFGGNHKQLPFEDITKEQYEELMTHIRDVDLTRIIEEDDETTLSENVACAGGACTLT